MTQRYFLAVAALGLLLTPLSPKLQAQSDSMQSTMHAGKKQVAAGHNQVQHQDEGQRIFEQNCSRCHTAPDGFSPNISGAVVRHMRVRASLSQHDAEEVLRFFNP
jgi:mono/diheme cytochrome c family protein